MNENTLGFNKEKSTATSLQDGKRTETFSERYVSPLPFPGPWDPKWPPWLVLPIYYGERSTEGPSQVSAVSNFKIMETLYLRPDIRSAVIQNTQTFLNMLSSDKEAAEIFYELLGIKNEERLVIPAAVLWFGGGALVGAVLGYLSRPD